MKRLLSLAMVCTALTLTAQTPSPWNGTWKLDRAKSHLTGSTYTLSKGPDGMWIETFGTLSYKFATDGKPYPVFDQDHKVLVTMPNAHTQKTVNQMKGKTTEVAIDTLSADGNTITETATHTRPNGTTYQTTETDKRVGPGEGFVGTWASERVGSTGNSPTTIKYTGDSISFSTPAQKSSLTARLDGTPATPVSPQMTAGVTVSYKKTTERRIDWSTMLNGKVVVQGYDEIAADGRSYSTTSWLTGSESEKTVEVYIKE
jgi:hypothetical protein